MRATTGWLKGAALSVIFIVVLAGCGTEPVPTNTGFTGTWAKETSSLEVALYLWHDGEEYRFRMFRESIDGTGRIDCDWDGNCEEFLDDRKIADLRFNLEETGDPASLLLHCNGLYSYPEDFEISYIHELNLSDDGLTLISYTMESQGARYEENARGMRTLEKYSDTVPDPPSPRVDHEP